MDEFEWLVAELVGRGVAVCLEKSADGGWACCLHQSSPPRFHVGEAATALDAVLAARSRMNGAAPSSVRLKIDWAALALPVGLLALVYLLARFRPLCPVC